MKHILRLFILLAMATMAFGQDRSSSFVQSDPSLATEVPAKPSAAHVAKPAAADDHSTIMYPNEQEPYMKEAYSPEPAQPVAAAPATENTAPMAKGSERNAPAAQPETRLRTRPEAASAVLPTATVLRIKLEQSLSTESVRRGQKVEATLTRPVEVDGRVILPAGTYVECEVLGAKNPRRIAGKPMLLLKARKAQLPEGGDLYFSASMIDTANPRHLDVDQEGRLRGVSDNAKDNVELAALTGTGAIAGAVIAGPAGFAVGTVTGAGMATGHRLVKHHHLTVPAGTELIFELDEPATTSREMASTRE